MRNAGFTLIELMVTVVIAAILLTVAVPSFQTVIKGNRLTAAANDFVTAMALARSEALKRGQAVRVTATNSGGGAGWAGGWRVWVANDGDTTFDAGSSDVELRIRAPLNTAIDTQSDNNVTEFVYRPSGLVNQADTIDLCDDRSGETGRLLDVSATGRVNVSNLTTCS